MSTPIPAKLYKYVTFARLDVLKNECIRFTQPAALNDPWELKPYLERLFTDEDFEREIMGPLLARPWQEMMDEALDTKWKELTPFQRSQIPGGLQGMKHLARQHFEANPHLLEEAFGEARTEINDRMGYMNPEGGRIFVEQLCNFFGILSLTVKPDNDLMWAHYAWNHTGMVLEFDTSHAFFTHRHTDADDLSGLKPVIYSPQRPALGSIYELRKFADAEFGQGWNPLIFTKSQSWSYEQEWRMARALKSADEIKDAASPAIHLFNLPAAAVTRIIVGAQMPEENRQIIRDFVATDERYSHVALSQAVMSNRTFALGIEALN